MKSQESQNRKPHPLVSMIPVAVLVGMLVLVGKLFGGDTLNGASQICLLLAAGTCLLLSMVCYKMPWSDYENALRRTFSDTSSSIIILLMIGMMAGSWMVSGTVPTLIYYGIQIVSPHTYLVCSCIICSGVSLLTGSSWSTIATIGVALMGIGQALGIPDGWAAGAIISGAYFGDKMSPLSDTTILASSCTKTELFTHIRYMMGTTVPTFVITLLIFLVAGWTLEVDGDVDVKMYLDGLSNTYRVSLLTLVVPIATIWLIAKRMPSLIVLFISSLVAGMFALALQGPVLTSIAQGGVSETVGTVWDVVKGLLMSFYTSTSVETGNESLNELVSTGGMEGMLPTVWLIMCALCFGSAMVVSGMLHSMMVSLIKIVRGTFGLVSSTVATGFFMNLITGDQYMSIILTSNLYGEVYRERGYESRLLSRTTEDGVTVTSVLIPWNTCGMTQATVLGVATLTYLPYCFFCIISPLMSMLVAALGWHIHRNKVS